MRRINEENIEKLSDLNKEELLKEIKNIDKSDEEIRPSCWPLPVEEQKVKMSQQKSSCYRRSGLRISRCLKIVY